MLTHTYPHKPPKNIKVTICYHQVDSPIYLWPDVCFGDLQAKKKTVVIHDTECPYWDKVLLNNTNPNSTNHPNMLINREGRATCVWSYAVTRLTNHFIQTLCLIYFMKLQMSLLRPRVKNLPTPASPELWWALSLPSLSGVRPYIRSETPVGGSKWPPAILGWLAGDESWKVCADWTKLTSHCLCLPWVSWVSGGAKMCLGSKSVLVHLYIHELNGKQLWGYQ